MKLTQKGQITIPHALRNRYGLDPHSEVVFEAVEGGVLIKPDPVSRGKQLKTELRKVRGCADAGLSSDEILTLTRGE